MDLSIKTAIESMDCAVLVQPGDDSRIISNITWDSRQVESDSAYLAIVGERVDGNTFIESAIESGATLAIATGTPDQSAIDTAKSNGAAIVLVQDPTDAISQLALAQRNALGAKVIGVTGSSGKTTTKDIIATVLSSSLATVATAANRNNELGVPSTVLSASESTEALVVEMGMRGFHQLETLCKFVKPSVGVITNIGTAHEELLGSQENIAKAKSELIATLPDGCGVAILNGDDPFTDKVIEFSTARERGLEIVRYGLDDSCDVRGSGVIFDEEGRPSFDIAFPDGSTGHVKLALMGAHNVSNALAAAAVGFVCGLAADCICSALALAANGAMRQEIVIASNGLKIINDAYNANPDSAAAALRLLSIMEAKGRKVAVLGDMLELGEAGADLHYGVGKLAAELGIDYVVAVGQLAENIARGARDAGCDSACVSEYEDATSALEGLSGKFGSGDVVLVKASRGMELEKIVKGLV